MATVSDLQGKFYKINVTALADGTTTYAVAPSATHHQIQITVRNGSSTIAAPAAGTLVVNGKAPGAPDHEPFITSIDLTDRANWLQLNKIGRLENIECVIASLTASHTVELNLTGWSTAT